jgi:hypothetical protein
MVMSKGLSNRKNSFAVMGLLLKLLKTLWQSTKECTMDAPVDVGLEGSHTLTQGTVLIQQFFQVHLAPPEPRWYTDPA